MYDALGHDQLVQALALSEARLAAIIAHSVDAVLMVDSDRRITMFNSGAERMFGYTAKEVMGKRLEQLGPKRFQEDYAARIQGFLESTDDTSRSPVNWPINLQRKTGDEFPAEFDMAKFTVRDTLVATIQLRDVTGRFQLFAAVAATKSLIDLSADAVITVDRRGRITLFNSSAEEIFGFNSSEVLGRPFGILVPPSLRDAYREHLQAFIDSFETVIKMTPDSPMLMLRRNGKEFQSEVGMAKFETQDEPVVAIRLRDVSEKLKAEELRIQLKAAEESAMLKSRLLSAVSHELRSPLSAILGFTSLLMEYEEQISTEERREHLTTIEESSRLLQRLVDDLLSLSSLETGVIEIKTEPVAVKQLFNSAIHSFRRLTSHQLKLVPKASTLVVLGDGSRLREVLSNLIDNAVKYSPGGGEIEIRARRVRESIQITVRDHGPGVPPDKLDVIFDAFYRGGNGQDDAVSGAGLGLAICRGFVEAQGGTIRASLPAGGGLAVSFTLPLASPPGTKNKKTPRRNAGVSSI